MLAKRDATGFDINASARSDKASERAARLIHIDGVIRIRDPWAAVVESFHWNHTGKEECRAKVWIFSGANSYYAKVVVAVDKC